MQMTYMPNTARVRKIFPEQEQNHDAKTMKIRKLEIVATYQNFDSHCDCRISKPSLQSVHDSCKIDTWRPVPIRHKWLQTWPRTQFLSRPWLPTSESNSQSVRSCIASMLMHFRCKIGEKLPFPNLRWPRHAMRSLTWSNRLGIQTVLRHLRLGFAKR